MFEITTDGRVYLNGKEKKQSIHSAGYKIVSKNKKLYYVHRLVAEAYIPNPENYETINHINGIKDDNRVENLEWCSKRQNAQHARLNGLSEKKSQGILDITYDEYLKMIQLKQGGHSYHSISRIMNIEYRRVRDTILGIRYKDYKEKREKNVSM